MKKSLIYCRVSTEEQAEKGYSLDAQENLCRDFAQINGYQIVGVFRDEGKSGTTLDRPALKDALSKCQQDNSINALIVQETDRLARNTKDHLTIKALLRKADVKIISVAQPMLDDSPEGNMIDTILASINQFQSDINSRKTKKGLIEKFHQGWWPCSAPLGYKNSSIEDPEGKPRNIIIKDTIKWPIIKEGFKLYLSNNYSVEEINDILFKKGLKSKNDKKVPHSVMTRILQNPFYAGIMRWAGFENKGNHEPMISLIEHQQILNIMDAHNLHRCRKRKYSFLLRGFIVCNICGQRYTAEKHPRKKKEYYHCSAKKRKHRNFGQNVEVEELERQVKEAFKTLQFKKEFIELIMEKLKKIYSQQKNSIKTRKMALLNQKKAIEAKRDIAEEKLISGTMSDEDYVRLRNRYKEDLGIIQNEICILDSQRNIDINVLHEVIKLARNVYASYKKAPYDLKRQYLGLFWDKFLVQDKIIVKAIPSKLIEILLDSNEVIIRGKKGPSSTDIITLLKDLEYLTHLKEKLAIIKEMQDASSISCRA